MFSFRRRKKEYDDPFKWPETIESARLIVAGLRRMGEEPSPHLLRLAGEKVD